MSSKSFSSCMLLMACHRETNFLTSSPRTKGRIEPDPIVVSKSFDLNTEMSFLFAFLYDLGAMFLGASPSIQPDRQKSTVFPLPMYSHYQCTRTILDGWKGPTYGLSHGNWRPAHALSLIFHLKALAKRSRSRMPRPPYSLANKSRNSLYSKNYLDGESKDVE